MSDGPITEPIDPDEADELEVEGVPLDPDSFGDGGENLEDEDETDEDG